jgi:hypothetical protein
MALRTAEDTLIWKRKLWIALCGGTVLGRGFGPVITQYWMNDLPLHWQIQAISQFRQAVTVLSLWTPRFSLCPVWDLCWTEWHRYSHRFLSVSTEALRCLCHPSCVFMYHWYRGCTNPGCQVAMATELVHWHLIFVCHQCVKCFMSPFCCLEFWDGGLFFG